MASLFGTKIKDTYQGILKLIDNLGLTASPKEITDGNGVGSGVFVANDGSLKAGDIHSTASIQNDGGYKDSTGALGTANQVLSTTGAVTTWVNATVNTVDSVNGQTGIVVLDSDDVSEGLTNLYFTDTRVDSNSNVTANTAKVGITSGQAADIVTNNAKISYTDAAAVALNTAKVGITSQQATDITTNNAKVGITSQQATDITTNNAKVSNVQSDWNAASGLSEVLNKPTITPAVVGGLQTDDGLALGATNKSITDSLANATGLKLGTGATVEFTKRVSQTGLGYSTFFGNQAGFSDDLTTNENTAFGHYASEFNVSGTLNTAVGSDASRFTTTGSYNTSVGRWALRMNTTGSQNVAVGSNCMTNTTTGSANLGIGYNALQANIGGAFNVSLGSNANTQRASNTGNIAIGSYSLQGTGNCNYSVGVGNNAMRGNAVGHSSVGVGRSAGQNSTGNNSIYIGDNAGISAVGTNQIIIGSNADGNGINTATIGDANITELHLMKPGAALSLRSPNSTVYDFSVDDAGVLGAAGVSPTTVNSITTGEPTGSDQVINIVSLTQAEYDAGTPVATTFYIIS
tara:strand:+ start:112 stop:1836 length:1725 start_codon:yes stop_codon:yes gene_type:complete